MVAKKPEQLEKVIKIPAKSLEQTDSDTEEEEEEEEDDDSP